MVLKNDDVPPPLKQAANNPPYPTTPSETSAPPFPLPSQETGAIRTDNVSPPAQKDREAEDSDYEWDSGSDIDEPPPISSGLPGVLRIGQTQQKEQRNAQDSSADGVPASLRVGPPQGMPRIQPTPSPPTHEEGAVVITHPESNEQVPQLRSREGSWAEVTNPSKEPIPLKSHNPYLRMQQTGQSGFGESASSSSVWAAPGPVVSSSSDPVELPSSPVVVNKTANLTLDDPWKDMEPARKSEPAEQAPLIPVGDEEIFQPPPGPPPQRTQQSTPPQASNPIYIPQTQASGDIPPPLPPRKSEEQPPARPVRPTVDTHQRTTSSTSDLNPASPRGKRKEFYQIKHIHWHDASGGKLRPAPILIQNLNGPCPLLALVNALVLSTPVGEVTALIETLRTREQVSLGLLLDAVFDELMSGRRGDAAHELPDVGDLYAFLVTLHTGMNVNPRFVPETPALLNAEQSDLHPAFRRQSDLSANSKPGGFEETREMRLYGTFGIPLIHGWLPGDGDLDAFVAFERSARTYDDATNLQFGEEELEQKLQSSGLSPEEQHMLQDIGFIKDFLTRWPTQLTTYGLDVITKTLKLGDFAILFRNDHFSTVYREPKSAKLFTLVTDAGYSTHDEIVWESLVDVNGKGSELFSGDFRPVGNNHTHTRAGSAGEPFSSMLDVNSDQAGWQNGQHSNGRVNSGIAPGRSSSAAAVTVPVAQEQETGIVGSSNPPTVRAANENGTGVMRTRAEQEDHDLALALQLQEEEEARHRRQQETARRQREDELSRRYLSNQSGRPGAVQQPQQPQQQQQQPQVPPRRPHNNTTSQRPSGNRGSRTNIAPRASDEIPPPTYDEAASGRPWQPPRNHPASPHAPMPQPPRAGDRQSAYAEQNGPALPQRRYSARPGGPTLLDQIPPGGRGRGAPSGVNAGVEKERCVVM